MHWIKINDATAMEAFGSKLAKHCRPGHRIFLQGELGSGKTTLVRGFLRAFGYTGIVKSPTYTLVETYQIDQQEIFHFDLYRINMPAELDAIGIQDYFSNTAICLIEWPEHGTAILQPADIHIDIHYQGNKRKLSLSPETPLIKSIIHSAQP